MRLYRSSHKYKGNYEATGKLAALRKTYRVSVLFSTIEIEKTFSY